MELTEGKLFTIEALNKLDGFVWPDDMNYACYNSERAIHVTFSETKPEFVDDSICIESGSFFKCRIGVKHPDHKISIVTRKEFEEVDGWIRHDGGDIPPVGSDVVVDVRYLENGTWLQSGCLCEFIEWLGVKFWRYHKDTSLKPNVQTGSDEGSSSFEDINIVSIYSEYGKLVSDIETMTARKAELLEMIKAYNLAHSIEVKEF